MNVLRLEKNTNGRDFLIGDIHGCFSRLRALLDAAAFDESRDRLFSVGDLVDRGPESHQAMEWLDKPWFFAVRGNHEQMAINFAAGHNHPFQYERNGGRWFIDLPDIEQQWIASRFEQLPLGIEVPVGDRRVGIVHAEVPGNDWHRLELATGAARETALWSRTIIDRGEDIEVANIDYVFVGHTPVDAELRALGNIIYTDTGAVFGRPMVLLCISRANCWTDAGETQH